MEKIAITGDTVSPSSLPPSSDPKAVSTVTNETGSVLTNDSPPDQVREAEPPKTEESQKQANKIGQVDGKSNEANNDSHGSASEKMDADEDLDDTITRERSAKFATGKDYYCWKCHKEFINLSCSSCPRSYHFKCLPNDANLPTGIQISNIPKKLLYSKIDYSTSPEYNKVPWNCSQCLVIKENEALHQSPSSPLSSINSDEFETLLKFALGTIKQTAEPSFHTPVDSVQFPLYRNFILHPMDFLTIDHNIRKGSYKCTASFLADIKWIVHNCYIYNDPTHVLTKNANLFWKVAKNEANEIEICPGCFMNFYVYPKTSFTEVCSKAHTLVWARLKGHPFWPAKVFQTDFDSKKVDCRFFGAHDRAWVAFDAVYLLSEVYPWPKNKSSKSKFDNAMNEMATYISKMNEKFPGAFTYAQPKTPFKPDPPSGWVPKVSSENSSETCKASGEESPSKSQTRTSGKSNAEKEVSATVPKVSDASSEDEDEKPLVIDAPPSEASSTRAKGKPTQVKGGKSTPGKTVQKVPEPGSGSGKKSKAPASKGTKRSSLTTSTSTGDASASKKRKASLDQGNNEGGSMNVDSKGLQGEPLELNNEKSPGTSGGTCVQLNQRQVASSSKKFASPVNEDTSTSKRKPATKKALSTPASSKGKNVQQGAVSSTKGRGKGNKKSTSEVNEKDESDEAVAPATAASAPASLNTSKGKFNSRAEGEGVSSSPQGGKRKDKKRSGPASTTATGLGKSNKGSKLPMKDATATTGTATTDLSTISSSATSGDSSSMEEEDLSTPSPGKKRKASSSKKQVQQQSPRSVANSPKKTLLGKKSIGPSVKSTTSTATASASTTASNNGTAAANNDPSQVKQLKDEIKGLKRQIVSLKEELKELKKAKETNTVEASEAVINETKRKQWCAGCLKEAQYFCCWNTSYCSYECQSKHWPEHMRVCQQAQVNHTNNSTSSTTAASTDGKGTTSSSGSQRGTRSNQQSTTATVPIIN